VFFRRREKTEASILDGSIAFDSEKGVWECGPAADTWRHRKALLEKCSKGGMMRSGNREDRKWFI
jgi:hypothetical protein